MRKLVAILMLCLYSPLFAVGVNVNVHYCSGSVAGISIFEHDEGGCCGEVETPKDCCENETSYIKANNTHQHYSAPKFVQPLTWLYVSFGDVLPTQLSNLQTSAFAYPQRLWPPPEKACVLNCTFRI